MTIIPKSIPHLHREPIFAEVPGHCTESREIREIGDIKPVGIGKDDVREESIEVLNTKATMYDGRQLNIKMSVMADIDHAWEQADTPAKSRKIIQKLFDRCTEDQKRGFTSTYGVVKRISPGKLSMACVYCTTKIRKNER